jgi:hypothetical protein
VTDLARLIVIMLVVPVVILVLGLPIAGTVKVLTAALAAVS